jgi:hypothetical protein
VSRFTTDLGSNTLEDAEEFESHRASRDAFDDFEEYGGPDDEEEEEEEEDEDPNEGFVSPPGCPY